MTISPARSDDAVRISQFVDQHADRIVGFLQDLIRIPSVWGDGAALTKAAEFLAEPLRGAGILTQLTPSGTEGMPNVLAQWGPASGDGLIFNGHMEVYPPSESWQRDPFGGEISAGQIYGVGVADMKAGTAAMTMAVTMLAEAGFRPERGIAVLAVPNHFEGGEGTRQALRDGLRGAYAINCEPSDLKVLLGQRGIAYVTVSVRGRAAHTTALDIGVNAVERAARVIQSVLEMPITGPDGQEIPDIKVCNVAQISGGVAHNLIPERCELTFDFRFPATQTQECVIRDVQDAVTRAVDRLDEFPVDVRLEPTCLRNPRSSLQVAEDAAVIRALGDAHGAVAGRPATHDTHKAWPDTPIFWEAGIEAATYGPGSMDCYWDDESVPVDDYLTAVKTYALAALSLTRPRHASPARPE